MKAAPLFAVFASTALLTGQEPGRYLPREAAVTFFCDTPAVLEERFADTDVAALLDSREFRDVIDETFAREKGGPDERVDEILETLRGRLRLAVRFAVGPEEAVVHEAGEWSSAGGTGRSTRVLVAGELRAEDTAALEEMAELATEKAERDQGLIDFDIAGESFRGWAGESGSTMILPHLRGGALVFYFGNAGIEDLVAEILTREEGEPLPDSGEAPIRLRIDIQRILEDLRPRIEEVGMPMDLEAFLELMRLDGLRTVDCVVTSEGAASVVDMAVDLDPQRPTLLDFFRPVEEGRPMLLDLVPRERADWMVGHLRFEELYTWVADLLVEFEAPLDMPAVETSFEEACGVRLKEDVIDHLGEEYLRLFTTEMPPPETFDPNAMVAETVVIGLEDAAAFEASFGKLLRNRGMHVGLETRDYRGIEVSSLKLMGMVDLQFAFADDAVVFALGGNPPGFEAVLDRMVGRREGKEPGPFPERIVRRLALMPEGWHDASVLDLQGALGMFDNPQFPVPEELSAMFETMGTLLSRYDLELLVSTTGIKDDRVTTRVIW